MKKLLFSRSLMFCLVLFLLLVGCKKKEEAVTPASCDSAVKKYEASLTAFTSDPNSKIKCEAFKADANNLLTCPSITAAQKSQYQQSIDAIACPQ